jgi:hypothetical protein
VEALRAWVQLKNMQAKKEYPWAESWAYNGVILR